ncbi:MAG: hypothetical protein NUW37_18700 [Planctomycetes bacterium]|nr:hypothetical protein [Planctomycetota bacterium]
MPVEVKDTKFEPENTQEKKKRKSRFRNCFFLLLLLLATSFGFYLGANFEGLVGSVLGYRETCIFVENESSSAIRNVTVRISGRSYSIQELEPGKQFYVKLQVDRESGISIEGESSRGKEFNWLIETYLDHSRDTTEKHRIVINVDGDSRYYQDSELVDRFSH